MGFLVGIIVCARGFKTNPRKHLWTCSRDERPWRQEDWKVTGIMEKVITGTNGGFRSLGQVNPKLMRKIDQELK